jgi:hypothetical protein
VNQQAKLHEALKLISQDKGAKPIRVGNFSVIGIFRDVNQGTMPWSGVS